MLRKRKEKKRKEKKPARRYLDLVWPKQRRGKERFWDAVTGLPISPIDSSKTLRL